MVTSTGAGDREPTHNPHYGVPRRSFWVGGRGQWPEVGGYWLIASSWQTT